MKRLITIENMFENEITRSILNLLTNFQGVQFKYIRYALNPENYVDQSKISKDTELKRNLDRITSFFNGKLEDLYVTGVIKKGCIKSREQLQYYLRLLGKNGLNVIRKERNGKKAKYFIKEGARNEGIRLENKECIDLFPQDKIKFFPIECLENECSEEIAERHVIYGLSDKMYSNLFNNDDRETIKTNLEKIESSLENIYNIKIKRLFKEKDKRLECFMESTKSDSIKEFLQEERDLLFGVFYNGILSSEYYHVDILHSKTIFFYRFKYDIHFRKPIDEHDIEKMSHVTVIKSWMDEMNEKQFCMHWSKSFLGKRYDLLKVDTEEVFKEDVFENDYNFSKSDIEEILQWGWDNRDLLEMCCPVEIAYSRYSKYRGLFVNRLYFDNSKFDMP